MSIRVSTTRIIKSLLLVYSVYDITNTLVYSSSNIRDIITKYNVKQYQIYTSNRSGKYYIVNDIPYRFSIYRETQYHTVHNGGIQIRNNTVKSYPDEIWKSIPGFKYQYCSNYGRFKLSYKDNEELIQLKKSRNASNRNYWDVKLYPITEDDIVMKPYQYRMTRVLAKVFLDSSLNLDWKLDKRDVDHIDNDSTNNHISNLRVISHRDNLLYASRVKSWGYTKRKCYAYDITNSTWNEYVSTGELCRDIYNSSNKGFFSNAYKHHSLCKGRYLVGYDKDEIMEVYNARYCK